MENFNLNGQKFTMPSGWHEVTYSDAMTIITENLSEIDTFALLSGIDLDVLKNTEDYSVVYYFMNAFTFIKTRPDSSKPQIPLSMTLGKYRLCNPTVIYEDPHDLGKMSVGQFNDMKDAYMNQALELKGDSEDDWIPTDIEMLEMMPSIVSIYVQKIRDGRYDYKKAKELVEDVRTKMTFKDVSSMGYFFFQRLNAYLNGSTKLVLKLNWIQRKSKQAYRNLMSGLVSMAH